MLTVNDTIVGPHKTVDSTEMDNTANGDSATYDWRRFNSPTDGIVTAVADVTGRPPADLPPVLESVDEEALRRLVAGPTDNSDGRVRVSFEFAGVFVTVARDGLIEVAAERGSHGGSPLDPRTDEEVSAILKRLFSTAANNDIAVEGGWTIRNGPELPDWDIHVTQLRKSQQRD